MNPTPNLPTPTCHIHPIRPLQPSNQPKIARTAVCPAAVHETETLLETVMVFKQKETERVTKSRRQGFAGTRPSRTSFSCCKKNEDERDTNPGLGEHNSATTI